MSTPPARGRINYQLYTFFHDREKVYIKFLREFLRDSTSKEIEREILDLLIDEMNEILEVVNDAWNYFPHKCLDALSPIEKILEHQKKNK